MKFWKKKTAPQGQDEFSEGHDFEDAHPEVSVDEEVSESEARDAKKKITTSSEMYLEDAGVIAFGKKRAAINLQWTLMEDGDSIKDKVLEADDLNSQDPTQNTVEMKLYTDPKPTGFIGVGSRTMASGRACGHW